MSQSRYETFRVIDGPPDELGLWAVTFVHARDGKVVEVTELDGKFVRYLWYGLRFADEPNTFARSVRVEPVPPSLESLEQRAEAAEAVIAVGGNERETP